MHAHFTASHVSYVALAPRNVANHDMLVSSMNMVPVMLLRKQTQQIALIILYEFGRLITKMSFSIIFNHRMRERFKATHLLMRVSCGLGNDYGYFFATLSAS